MADKVKVGVIGLGAIGTKHSGVLKNVPNAELAALCDIKPDLLAAKGREFGVDRLFEDYRKMIKEPDLDAIYVCVPNYRHCPLTVDSLKAGKHVFCEKPMAMSAAEGRRMVAARKAAKRLLQMGMVWRQNAEAQTIKHYIDKGAFGDIYHIRVVLRRRRGIPGLGGWFTTKAMSGGGGMIDIGVHFLDLVMWLANCWRPERVSANTYAAFGHKMEEYKYLGMWAGPPNYGGVFDVDDYATGLVRFKSRITLSFEISWAQNVPEGSFAEILGDKGGCRAFDGTPLTIMTEDEGHIVDLQPKFTTRDGFLIQSQIFMNAIQGKGEVAATGEQGVAVMEVLDAVYQSAKQGKEVIVKRK